MVVHDGLHLLGRLSSRGGHCVSNNDGLHHGWRRELTTHSINTAPDILGDVNAETGQGASQSQTRLISLANSFALLSITAVFLGLEADPFNPDAYLGYYLFAYVPMLTLFSIRFRNIWQLEKNRLLLRNRIGLVAIVCWAFCQFSYAWQVFVWEGNLQWLLQNDFLFQVSEHLERLSFIGG